MRLRQAQKTEGRLYSQAPLPPFIPGSRKIFCSSAAPVFFVLALSAALFDGIHDFESGSRFETGKNRTNGIAKNTPKIIFTHGIQLQLRKKRTGRRGGLLPQGLASSSRDTRSKTGATIGTSSPGGVGASSSSSSSSSSSGLNVYPYKYSSGPGPPPTARTNTSLSQSDFVQQSYQYGGSSSSSSYSPASNHLQSQTTLSGVETETTPSSSSTSKGSCGTSSSSAQKDKANMDFYQDHPLSSNPGGSLHLDDHRRQCQQGAKSPRKSPAAGRMPLSNPVFVNPPPGGEKVDLNLSRRTSSSRAEEVERAPSSVVDVHRPSPRPGSLFRQSLSQHSSQAESFSPQTQAGKLPNKPATASRTIKHPFVVFSKGLRFIAVQHILQDNPRASCELKTVDGFEGKMTPLLYLLMMYRRYKNDLLSESFLEESESNAGNRKNRFATTSSASEPAVPRSWCSPSANGVAAGDDRNMGEDGHGAANSRARAAGNANVVPEVKKRLPQLLSRVARQQLSRISCVFSCNLA
ncbi:unnamed protein product [Amoebophrya sp. A120]|nr:unnamed protein product [Amoebophrya sp. A120]|eukprot:GSA120T00019659001.1